MMSPTMMMKRLQPKMPSDRAVLAFKSKVSESLQLLSYIDNQDKEHIWRFWKTMSTAVKIAVNGKGDIVDTPRRNSKLLRKRDNRGDLGSLQHLDEKFIYVYIADKQCKKVGFRVLKLENNEKNSLFLDSHAIDIDTERNEDNEVECEQMWHYKNASSDSAGASVESGHPGSSPNSVQGSPELSKKVKEKVRILGSNATKLAWPVSRPVTRSFQPSKQTDTPHELANSHSKADDNSEEITEGNFGKDKISDPQNIASSVPQDVGISVNEPVDSTNCGKESLGALRLTILPMGTNVIQLGEEYQLPQEQASISRGESRVDGDFVKVSGSEGNEVTDRSFSEIISSSKTDGTINTIEDNGAEDVTTNYTAVSMGYDHPNSAAKTASTDEMKIQTVSKEFSIDPVNPETRLQGTLAQRNASDIETIISALEEELKKSGSDIKTISVSESDATLTTSREAVPEADESISVGKFVDSAQLPQVHIINTQLENVIWTSVGEIQIVGANQEETSASTTVVTSESHPVEAEYDVVEYEVQADKQIKKGRRKKAKKQDMPGVKDENLDRTCPICHRVLRYASSMPAHMRIHTGVKPYSCGQCDRKFTTKANRDRHEATHVGLKPFECSVCAKAFTEKRSLSVHMRTHTGERPFVCQVCGQSFTQKCTLRVHMDRHSNKKGHLCDLCGKAFRQKCQLEIHVKRHNRQAAFPCKECSTKCYTRGDLMRHMIKHTGERPFQCSECPRAFTRKQYLVDHLNGHYGKKPYQCSICAARFHDMGSCHRHLKKHKMEKNSETKNTEQAAVLSCKDFHQILEGTHIGQIIKLEDGTEAVVKAVLSESDGSTVYHITCLNNLDNVTTLQNMAMVEEGMETAPESETLPTHS